MSDRPTPETESHFPSSRHKDDSWVVSCEIGLIRNFERRRDAAIERFESSQEARATLKRELDEARETDDLLNTIRKLECELAEAVKARDHNRTCVKRLTEERDEARQNAKHWCDMHILAVKDFNEARELARKLRDAMNAITPYIGYPSTPTDVVYQFRNALTKAKELLP